MSEDSDDDVIDTPQVPHVDPDAEFVMDPDVFEQNMDAWCRTVGDVMNALKTLCKIKTQAHDMACADILDLQAELHRAETRIGELKQQDHILRTELGLSYQKEHELEMELQNLKVVELRRSKRTRKPSKRGRDELK